MTHEFAESDWKTFREVREAALERFCADLLARAVQLCRDAGASNHERYLALRRRLREGDKEMARVFEAPRRSHMLLLLAVLHSRGLLEPEEFARFTPAMRRAVESIAEINQGDRAPGR